MNISASGTVNMIDFKICSKCGVRKDAVLDFYMCSGKWRSDCKVCTIRANIKYQRKVRLNLTPKQRHDKRVYMREYYALNPDRFQTYRETFCKKNPDYYRDYRAGKRRKECEGKSLPSQDQ